MGPTWGPPGPVGPRWAPCSPHVHCYQGCFTYVFHTVALDVGDFELRTQKYRDTSSVEGLAVRAIKTEIDFRFLLWIYWLPPHCHSAANMGARLGTWDIKRARNPCMYPRLEAAVNTINSPIRWIISTTFMAYQELMIYLPYLMPTND